MKSKTANSGPAHACLSRMKTPRAPPSLPLFPPGRPRRPRPPTPPPELKKRPLKKLLPATPATMLAPKGRAAPTARSETASKGGAIGASNRQRRRRVRPHRMLRWPGEPTLRRHLYSRWAYWAMGTRMTRTARFLGGAMHPDPCWRCIRESDLIWPWRSGARADGRPRTTQHVTAGCR